MTKQLDPFTDYKKETDTASIENTSKFLGASNNSYFEKSTSERDAIIEQAITKYHSEDASEETKAECREIIIHNLYFLILAIMGKYKFPKFIFEDAVQNGICEVLLALENVKDEKRTKFSSFIHYYLKAAACTTTRTMPVIKAPALRSQPRNLLKYYKDSSISNEIIESEEEEDIIQPITVSETIPHISDEFLSDEDNQDVPVDTLTLRNEYSQQVMTIYKVYNVDSTIANNYNELSQKFIEATDTEDILLEEEYISILSKMLQVLPSVDSSKTRRRYNKELDSLITTEEDTYLTDKEKLVIIHHFGIFGAPQMTLEEIAKLFAAKGNKVSKQRIFQLQKTAFTKIRHYFKMHKIEFNPKIE